MFTRVKKEKTEGGTTPPNVNVKTTPGFINISLEDFFHR